MEESIRPLEVVCRHFTTEFANEEVKQLRRRLNNAYVRNHRAQKKLTEITRRLDVESLQKLHLQRVVLILMKMNSALSDTSEIADNTGA